MCTGFIWSSRAQLSSGLWGSHEGCSQKHRASVGESLFLSSGGSDCWVFWSTLRWSLQSGWSGECDTLNTCFQRWDVYTIITSWNSHPDLPRFLSDGLRSGLWLGHSKTWTLFVLYHSLVEPLLFLESSCCMFSYCSVESSVSTQPCHAHCCCLWSWWWTLLTLARCDGLLFAKKFPLVPLWPLPILNISLSMIFVPQSLLFWGVYECYNTTMAVYQCE